MLPPEAFRGEVPTTPAASRFGTLGPPSATPTPQASTATTPAVMRPRSLQQLMRLTEAQNSTVALLLTRFSQDREAVSNELDILSARLNRLGATGANEGLTQSVVAAIQAKVAQQRKLEEELKLLRSRAFSMATPRVDDTGRSRASSFASASSAQSTMSETEDEELQRRAKEALQRVQGLEPDVIQRIVLILSLIHI